MSEKETYGICPACGCNVPVHSGDEGTNSFRSVDIEKLMAVVEAAKKLQPLLNLIADEEIWLDDALEGLGG